MESLQVHCFRCKTKTSPAVGSVTTKQTANGRHAVSSKCSVCERKNTSLVKSDVYHSLNLSNSGNPPDDQR